MLTGTISPVYSWLLLADPPLTRILLSMNTGLAAMEPSPGSVLHLTAEYWPYARTGGLAEAVRGMATHQARAGRETVVALPLYRRIRELNLSLEPVVPPYTIRTPRGEEPARLLRDTSTPAGTPTVLFVENDEWFDRPGIYGEGGDYPDNPLRFSFFCRAVLEALPALFPSPPILHPHDWHTALAAVYLRTQYSGRPFHREIPTVFTVHNAGYQGYYDPTLLPEIDLGWELFQLDAMEWYGKVNLLKGGLSFADMVTTVSPTHAHELRTRAGGFGLHESFSLLQDRFIGILNGIDSTVWDPESDPAIEARYSADTLEGKARCKEAFQRTHGLPIDAECPLFAMTARLVEQKGLDILLGTQMIGRLPAQWAFLGSGESRYEEAIAQLSARHPEQVTHCFDFTELREHHLLAAADFLMMPSLYEPCGLTQMRAQRYGALPVVRRVGGLADTVEDRITGFIFDEYQPWALEEAVECAIDLYRNRESWEARVRTAMARDFRWDRSTAAYETVYEAASRRRSRILQGQDAPRDPS